MKIKTTTILKNLKGEEMKMVTKTKVVNGELVTTEEEPMVFRELVTNLLNSENQENKLTAEHKNKAFQIMKKLWEGDETDLTVDQRSLIIDRARIFYPTMTAGVIADYLEEKEDKLTK